MNYVEFWKTHNLANFLKKNFLKEKELNLVINWLTSVDGQKYSRQIHKLSVPDAIRLAFKSQSEPKKINLKRKESVTMVKDYGNGWTWVKLNNEFAFIRDAIVLQSCLRKQVEKDTTIYALRFKNRTWINLEFDPSNNEVSQVEGFRNKEIETQFWPMILDLIFVSKFFGENVAVNGKALHKIGHGKDKHGLFIWTQRPEILEFDSSLIISEIASNKQLAETLIIKGNLFIQKNSNIEKIAKKLIVEGSLYLNECSSLSQIADEIIVSGEIDVKQCPKLVMF